MNLPTLKTIHPLNPCTMTDTLVSRLSRERSSDPCVNLDIKEQIIWSNMSSQVRRLQE